ncbi:9271_t:CDS:2 [Acaulospora colombiana]|uniref:9271_t:CDS:1 n=1 Tax=Acaulospora colombiana TaxID=27376 RepID=A0ACA9KFT1_9GLOM|nr:9271_t:CDS:2 [Acaulospora colombiana]
MSNRELEIQVCKLLFKTLQEEKITEHIPDNVFVRAAEVAKSKLLTATLKETEEQGNFIFDWDHNDLLSHLVHMSAKLHRNMINENIRRKDQLIQSFHYAQNSGDFNRDEYNLKLEFIQNVRTLLPGFENLFALDWFVNGQQHDRGHLVFISNVGILAVVEVKYIAPDATQNVKEQSRTQVKERAKRFKTEAAKKFKMVTIGVTFTNEDERPTQFVNRIDKNIAYSVAEYTRRRAFWRGGLGFAARFVLLR